MTPTGYDLVARALAQARATAASQAGRHEVDRIILIFVGMFSALDPDFDRRRFGAIAHGRQLSADHP
jgi:hypothetical protein